MHGMRKLRNIFLIAALAAGAAGHAGAATLRVGPAEQYKTPSAAANAVKDGDIVEIAPGTYNDCAVWRANNLTLRGRDGNARPHLRDTVCQEKAIWVISGTNTVVENVEFSGMASKWKNGAGIRHQGKNLTVRNVFFHDGEQGILGGGIEPDDNILIEKSEFARLGKEGYAHSVYFGTAQSVTLRRNYFHDCTDFGHCVKSRALRNIIECNVIASLQGKNSHELDLPNGGHAEVRRNVIQQGPKSANNRMITFATETPNNPKNLNPDQTFIFEQNIVINDKSRGPFFSIVKHPNTKLNIRNNKFVGAGPLPYEPGNDWKQSRYSAGMPRYPELPKICG